tara:strand:- start:352 stop:2343 length:1992 start_codon:yes stop_codon:yes gene_type:complete
VKLFGILFLFFLHSCAGITPLNDNDWKRYYSDDFLAAVEKVIDLREEDKWEESIEYLMALDEVNLSKEEKAFRRNLIGVHFLNNKNFEKAIFHFSQASSFEVEDLRLMATINLNLANANFQLGLFEESLKNLSQVDSSYLGQEGQKSFYLLNYEIATYVEDKALQFDSLVGFVRSFGSSSPDEYKDSLRAFEILIKGKTIESQITIAEKLIEKINQQSLKYVLEIIERSYFSGFTSDAKKLMASLEVLDWVNSNANEQVLRFKERLGAFSEIDTKAIGVVLPLSGKYKKFGVRILRGIHSAFQGGLDKKGFRLIVEDSKSSSIIGAQAIKKLVKRYKVSSVIGGIESSSATTYFEELRKYQVIFLSLAKVLTPEKSKTQFLVEIPGSVESEVRAVLSRMSSEFPSSKAAVVFPKSHIGKSYLNTFWNLSSEYGVEVVDAVSFDPSKKDLRDPIKDLLGLKYNRERKEELEILNQVYSLEKSVIRRVQKLKPLVDFDWVFIPSAPYSAAQIIPSFSYFDATNEVLVGPSSWRSSVVMEVSRGKRGVNFNLSKSLPGGEKKLFKESYGYAPKLPEARGHNAILFLTELFKERDLSEITSREDLFNSVSGVDEIKISSGLFSLIKNRWNLDFEIGHFRGKYAQSGLRYVKREAKEEITGGQSEEEE